MYKGNVAHLQFALQREPVDPKFRVEGVASTNHSSSKKPGLSDLLCGLKIWTQHSFVLSQITRLTDGRTDRILIARPHLHSVQRGKNHYNDSDFK